MVALPVGTFLFFPRQSLAFQNPQSYYDWGPSQIRVNARVLGVQVFAESSSSSQSKVKGIGDYAKFNYSLGFTANLGSDNPFHFLKTLQENATLALTFDPKRKEEIRLEISGRRLEEMEKLVNSNRIQGLAVASRNYRQSLEAATAGLEKAKESLVNPQELIEKYQEDAARHALTLQEISAKVSESAQAPLDLAINVSEKVEDRAADLTGKAPVPVDVLDRLQSLKDQGLLTGEELQTVVSSKTRVEARELVRKYAEEGIFPQADLHKFDETAREKFGEDYDRVVELKKFFELKKLEEEKPDEDMIKKVQDFAKTYKAGETVPSEIRRYWVPLVRLEELQNTFRPDLLNETAMMANQANYEKFQEVVKRIQPRPEDVAQVEKIIFQNPNAALDPFYERLRRIAEKFGTSEGGSQVPGVPVSVKSCPGNSHWATVPYLPDGGYCVPNITYTPYQPAAGTAQGNKITGDQSESVCPSKYHRNYPGGPCVPDTYFGPSLNYSTYTPGAFPSPIYGPVACPGGYFWTGTACLDSSRACGGGAYWDDRTKVCVADSRMFINQCGPGEYAGPKGVCTPYDKGEEASKCFSANKFWTGRECLDKTPEGGAGITCPQGQIWDDKTKACASYGSGSTDSRPVAPSRESQESACHAGGGVCVSWVNGACGCEQPRSNTDTSGNVGACPVGQYRGPGGCYGNNGSRSCPQGQYQGPGGYCVSSNVSDSPSFDAQESTCRAGGGVCVSWVNGACGCERSGGSSGGTYYGGGTPSTPPSGYGSCFSGQYWNGSSCVSNTYTPPSTTESPEQACLRGTGCSWTGSSCNCSPTTNTAPTPSPSPEPTPTTAPSPSPSPEPSPSSSCPSGSYWNGSSCVTGQY